jgi:hypothetical protein
MTKQMTQRSVRVDVAVNEEGERRGFRMKGIQDAVAEKELEEGHWMDKKIGDWESEDVKKQVRRPALLLVSKHIGSANTIIVADLCFVQYSKDYTKE